MGAKWVGITVLAAVGLLGCSTVTEIERGCDPYARWEVDGERVATWLRDTDPVDVDSLIAIAGETGKVNNLNLCWYTSSGDIYGILRARRADWQADVEMLFENNGEWRHIESRMRTWPPELPG